MEEGNIIINNKATLNDALRRIGEYILDGLQEEEACTLIGIKYDDFKRIKEDNEGVRHFLNKKRIQFKHKHLKEIGDKKSDKNSQWILEKVFPDEFGSKRKPTEDMGSFVGAIIKEIQNDHNTASIVREVPATEIEAKRGPTEFSVDQVLK